MRPLALILALVLIALPITARAQYVQDFVYFMPPLPRDVVDTFKDPNVRAALVFKRQEPSPAYHVVEAQQPSSQRSEARAEAARALAAYKISVERAGYPSNYVSTAILFATLTAYQVTKQERLEDQNYAPNLWRGLSQRMAQRSPVREWSNERRQSFSDIVGIAAIEFLVTADEVAKTKDRAKAADVNQGARKLMHEIWNIDIDKTPLDELVCANEALPVNNCARYKYVISHGAIGNPFEEIERALKTHHEMYVK